MSLLAFDVSIHVRAATVRNTKHTSGLVTVEALAPTPEELATLPKERQESILQERQDIIRALCEKIIVWSDRRVKLVGVIDGSEAAQFDLKRPRWYNAPQL